MADISLPPKDAPNATSPSSIRADAERYPAFNRELDASADLLRDLVLQAPPNLTRGRNFRSIGELLKAGVSATGLRRLSTENLRTLLDLFTKSAADYLDGWFEGELVKAWFGFDAIVGNYASPYAPGTAYVLLHHAFGEVNGKKRLWGHAIGGMGAITQAMARSAASHGVEIETDAPVREVLIEKGRAAGVVLADGRVVRGAAVAANVDPKRLYTADDPGGRARSGLSSPHARVALRLRHVPDQCRALRAAELHGAARHAPRDHHTAGIILGPSLGYMDRAYCDARSSDGAASRSSSWSSLRPWTIRWRRAGRMSPACSASTWRRNCPTAARGTIIASASPT